MTEESERRAQTASIFERLRQSGDPPQHPDPPPPEVPTGVSKPPDPFLQAWSALKHWPSPAERPDDAEPTDAEPTDSAPTDAEPTDSEPTDAASSSAPPTTAATSPAGQIPNAPGPSATTLASPPPTRSEPQAAAPPSAGSVPVPDDLPSLGSPPDAERALPPFPRILAIANQKGGVGKTTTAVNLGAALAETGYRVLVVDLDPQGNATTGLGVNVRSLHTSIYDVLLHDLPLEDVVEATTLRNLFLAPATIDLAGAEIELVPAFSRELRLRRGLNPIAPEFDFVLIDCPPSLGLLTINGLAAATEVVVPIQCEYYALEGLGQLLRNVNLVQANLNPTLVVSRIILTMYDARTRLAEQVVADVRSHFGSRVCRNVVPRTVRLSEAPSFGQPITVFDPSSRGAVAYRELAKEVSGGSSQRVG